MDNKEKKGIELINAEEFLKQKFNKERISPLLVKLLEKILHLGEMNEVLATMDPSLEGIPFCVEVVKLMGQELEIEGLDNIPNDGTLYTFASNHPLGGGDGILLSSLVGGKYGSLQLFVNDFLMAVKPLQCLSIPINKVGTQLRDLPVLMKEAYASDRQVMLFPAGLCSREIDGKVQDLKWNKSFIKFSRENGRYIVPVHFYGENSKRFYRVANLCKKLKIKFNFAMLLLPGEFVRTRGKHYKIVFGKPIPPEFFDKSRTDLEWAAWVREEVYKL